MKFCLLESNVGSWKARSNMRTLLNMEQKLLFFFSRALSHWIFLAKSETFNLEFFSSFIHFTLLRSLMFCFKLGNGMVRNETKWIKKTSYWSFSIIQVILQHHCYSSRQTWSVLITVYNNLTENITYAHLLSHIAPCGHLDRACFVEELNERKKIWKPRCLSVEVIDKSNNSLGHGFFQDKSELFLCCIFDPSFSRFKWKCNYTDYERWRWVKRFVKPMSGTVSTWSNQ